MNDCPMEPNCHGLDAQRAKLDKYVVEQGMDRDQVLAAFASDYGTQAILARPIDKGFNRLAWIFPYLVGIAGACAAVVIARRWSRVPAGLPAARRRQTTPRCAPDWTMSSATSINGTDAERGRAEDRRRHDPATFDEPGSSAVERRQLQPWHFFVLLSLVAATVAVVLARRHAPSTWC